MALRNILKDDDPGLSKKSRTITSFDKRLFTLLDDMRETLVNADGLGLAAPQVGVLRRVALIADTTIEAETLDEQIIELINPEIIFEDGEQCGSEGCLSIPGVYGLVSRPNTVKIKSYDRHGKEFELETSALTARAIFHEIDHLNGVLFTDIMERLLTDEEIEEMKTERAKE
ncbi:MAG: peptide deformylase [Oscillospiraceae bacterium]|jgi:peptide deformylase|nr:peptide deformylase [Oscillospiraceae bacterium]